MKKKTILIFALIFMLVSLVGCGQKTEDNEEKPFVGLTSYLYSDTHVANIRKAILAAAEDGPFVIESADSKADNTTEANNYQVFLTKGAQYLITDKYDGNVQPVLDLCMQNDVGLVLYNTNQPNDEQADSYEPFYFVSSAAPESGRIQGQIISEYWKTHPEADKNGNGKIDYVMLQGNLGLYDTEMRTKYSIEEIQNNGIEVNEIITVSCDFSRSIAQDQMASIISARGDEIEVVIANNDDMALGAIESLKAAGYFTSEETYLPVVGVDATAVGLDAVKDGTLLGTAFNDPFVIGNVAYQCVCWMYEGNTPITQAMLDEKGFTKAKIDDHKRIWVSYDAVTTDNVDEYIEKYYK